MGRKREKARDFLEKRKIRNTSHSAGENEASVHAKGRPSYRGKGKKNDNALVKEGTQMGWGKGKPLPCRGGRKKK